MSSVLTFIKTGGVMMYPLIICSIALIAIAIERAISLRKAAVDGDALLEEVKAALREGGFCPDSETVAREEQTYRNKEEVKAASSRPEGDTTRATAVCERFGGPVGRIFARGLKNARRPADAIEMAMEQEASNEMPQLEANLPVLRTIVNISPLLGLLGTIAGMIASFRAASQTGLTNPTQVLGGISEALISTATGISLAVLGFLFYNYFANLSKKIVEDIEYYGAELVNFLTGRVD